MHTKKVLDTSIHTKFLPRQVIVFPCVGYEEKVREASRRRPVKKPFWMGLSDSRGVEKVGKAPLKLGLHLLRRAFIIIMASSPPPLFLCLSLSLISSYLSFLYFLQIPLKLPFLFLSLGLPFISSHTPHFSHFFFFFFQ